MKSHIPDNLNQSRIYAFRHIIFPGMMITILLGQNLAAGFSPDSAGRLYDLHESRQLLPDIEDGYGVVFRDLNRDDFPDIYVVRFRNLNRLFLNTGGQIPFADWTIHSGLGGNLMPRGLQNLELGAASADLNNDGLPDMAIAGWGETTRIFVQERNFYFRDITETSGLTHPIDGNGAFWSDINRDGNLDLLITDEHHPNHIFLGTGKGTFYNVSQEWGISGNRVSQGAAFGDIDGDGYPDLYICNWFAEDELYRHTGQNRFERMRPGIRHLSDTLNSNGISLGDIDNDGDLDLLVTDRDGKSALYRNDILPGDSLWNLTEITETVNLSMPFAAYGTVIADFNNDGHSDIWINTIGPNRLYLQDTNGLFYQAFEGAFFPKPYPKYYSTGAACADIDRDGDLDLFVSNKDTTSILYLNPADNDLFIQIKIVGIRSNRDAIGTKIWLYRQDDTGRPKRLVGFREISGGGGYLSQNSLVVHFGGTDSGRYQAIIQFPSGIIREMNSLSNGQVYTVHEYDGLMKAYYLSLQTVKRIVGTPLFWLNVLLYLVLIISIILYAIFASKRYRWAPRHAVLYFSLVIIVLYGIFIALQENPLRFRLFIQILIMGGLFLLLSFFMEKIRRLEITRHKYRTVLREFSQKLIFMKSNQELFQKIIETIGDLTHPRFCAYYQFQENRLTLAARRGDFNAPGDFPITGEQLTDLLSSQPAFLRQQFQSSQFKTFYHFPVFRDKSLFGVLIITDPFQRRPFSPEDVEVFRTLAGQAAIAIENNRYIDETKKLIQKVTESQTREKYLNQLEKANKKLKSKNKQLKTLFEDLKNTQAQLVQSEKMAGLGQLVAGVAHELNNPISYIYANMKTLENYTVAISQLLTLFREMPASEEKIQDFFRSLQQIQSNFDLDFIHGDIQSLIQESIVGSDRVKAVVQNLRNFSRLDEGEFKLADVHEGLDSTLVLLTSEVKNRITLHKDYGDLPKILCHPGNLNQVFMNILLNAIQAIEKTGNIWITTRPQDQNIRISIRDDGRGIPARNRDKIFDPFFTTKPVGKGTGLGLSISYNIIRQHQGKIDFASREGEGTEFTIHLPLLSKKSSAATK